MPLEAEFLDLMPETITVQQDTGATDLYNTRGHATAASFRARIEQTSTEVMDMQGQQRVSQAVVYVGFKSAGAGLWAPVDGTEDFDPLTDRLNLPAAYKPQSPVILRVERLDDEAGFYCWVFYT